MRWTVLPHVLDVESAVGRKMSPRQEYLSRKLQHCSAKASLKVT